MIKLEFCSQAIHRTQKDQYNRLRRSLRLRALQRLADEPIGGVDVSGDADAQYPRSLGVAGAGEVLGCAL